MIKYFFIALILFGLFLTRPSEAVRTCEQINAPEYCEILNQE